MNFDIESDNENHPANESQETLLRVAALHWAQVAIGPRTAKQEDRAFTALQEAMLNAGVLAPHDELFDIEPDTCDVGEGNDRHVLFIRINGPEMRGHVIVAERSL